MFPSSLGVKAHVLEWPSRPFVQQAPRSLPFSCAWLALLERHLPLLLWKVHGTHLPQDLCTSPESSAPSLQCSLPPHHPLIFVSISASQQRPPCPAHVQFSTVPIRRSHPPSSLKFASLGTALEYKKSLTQPAVYFPPQLEQKPHVKGQGLTSMSSAPRVVYYI